VCGSKNGNHEGFKKYGAKRFSEMFEELKKRTTKEKRANL